MVVPEECEVGSEDGLDYLASLFQNSDFKSIMQVHSKIQEVERMQSKSSDSKMKSFILQNELKTLTSIESLKLQDILNSPRFKALFSAMDTVSAKEYEPKLPQINLESDSDREDEPHVKIVRIYRFKPQELGATLKRDDRGNILVGRIMHGSAADKSCLLQPGDEVKEINGIKAVGRSLDEVAKILSKTSNGCLTFKIVQGRNNTLHSNDYVSHLKANFEYNPSYDRTCPCPEAGLPFKRGDILKLISCDDKMWWQATLVNDPLQRSGLVPSREYQDKRRSQSATSEDSLSSSQSKDSSNKKHNHRSLSFRRKKKAKKIMFSSAKSLERDAEIMHCYDEVYLLYPDPGQPRPVILVGAPGVGCDELRLRVISHKNAQYASPIPHTTRAPKQQEINGRDLIFVTRSEMERGIKSRQFMEHMEYKGHLYGTTFEAVEQVMRTGKSCVLHLQPQSLKKLRGSKLKPYIVLVKPPSFERLKVTRRDPTLQHRLSGSKQFKDEELLAMIKVSEEIEKHFASFIDKVLVNDEINAAFRDLLAIIDDTRLKPQWTSTAWS